MEPIHLPKDVERENVTFLILVLAFHHHFAQVDLVAPCLLQDVVLHQVVVAKTCLRSLDLVCFVAPNQRFLPPNHRQQQLCGKRPTRSWKLVASVTVILHSLFSIRSLVILFNPCSVFITRWIVTAAARLPASNMTVSQYVYVQHRMPPLELIHLNSSSRLVKLEQQPDEVAVSDFLQKLLQLLFFGCSNDESMCVFSEKSVDHSSRIGMTKFHMQARHRGLGGFSRSSSLARSKARCSS